MIGENYFRSDIIQKLISNNGNIQNARAVLDEISKSEHTPSTKHANPYIYINRQDDLQHIVHSLNSAPQKLLLLGGFQGAGKSILIRSILPACPEHLLIYWYECSKITNLDDILLSLCAFFDKKLRKSIFPPKEKASVSIDERLISYLKNLNRPLLIIIDSFEFLVNPAQTIEDEELKHFFNFILAHDHIKIILIGQRLPLEDMDVNEEFVSNIRLSGLDEDMSKQILRDKGMTGSNTILTEIYKYCRGYPWLLLLTANISSKYGISADKIVKEMQTYEDSFESYLIKKIYHQLSEKENKIINYLSIIRHPVNVPTLQVIDKSLLEPNKSLENLTHLMITQQSGSRFYVNNTVRKYTYNIIPVDLKYNLHKNVSTFYTNEIAKKLAERTIRLSRKLLHSEQHFHNLSAAKLQTEKEKFDKKKQLAINYLPTAMKDPYYFSDMIKPDFQQPLKIEEETTQFEFAPEIKAHIIYPDQPVEIEVPPPQFKTTEPAKEEYLDIDGFKIELSDEEKELLKDETFETTLPEKKTITANIPPVIIPEKEEEFQEDLLFDIGLDTSDMSVVTHNEDLVESLRFVALGYASENKHETAIDRFKEALDLSEKLKNEEKMAQIYSPMAESYMFLKQYDLAIECYLNAKSIYEDLQDYTYIPEIITSIGKVYSECYQHEKAILHYNEVLKLPQEQLTNQVKAKVYMGLGEIFDYRSQFNEALRYYSQALQSFDEIGDLINQANLYSRIALIYDDLKDYGEAIKNYEKSLNIDKQLGRKHSYASTLANLAAVNDEIGENAMAINYYKQSLIIDKELKNFEGLYKTLNRLGSIYTEMDQLQNALKYYQQELKVAKIVKDPYWIAMAYLDLGDFSYLLNDYIKSAKYYFISQKVISKSISTDSKEKIERRIKQLQEHIPEDQLENLKIQIFSK